jgi:hypothetical protein
MPDTLTEGQRVQIKDREATPDDAKSGLFYNYYRGLTGIVQKVYDTNDEVAVTIDISSLPEPIATRHEDIRQGMRSKWLDGLSEEARNRLTDAEKDFVLRYSILVTAADVSPLEKASIAASKSIEERAAIPEEPRRKTSADFEAAEEEYLRSRQDKS